MKKYWLLLLCVMFVSPAFAQVDKALETVHTGGKAVIHGPALAKTVRRYVGHLLKSSQISNVSLARIDNMAGSPLVYVRLAERIANRTGGILSARLLKPGEVYRYINRDDQGQLNVPQSFAEDDGALYRGISVHNLLSLERISRKGMEIRKSEFPVIHSSYDLGVALGYIYPEETVYKDVPTALLELPVVVKISFTKKMLKKNPPTMLINKEVFFGKDIKPQFIPEIMVCLEVNGQAGWYRVVWENGQMIFVSVPSTLVMQSIDY